MHERHDRERLGTLRAEWAHSTSYTCTGLGAVAVPPQLQHIPVAELKARFASSQSARYIDIGGWDLRSEIICLRRLASIPGVLFHVSSS